MTEPNPKAEGTDSSRSRALCRVAMLVCVLVGLSAVWGIVDSVRVHPRVWGLLGFEVVTLASAVLGALVGTGRLREAPALAAASVGATIFAAATLGRFSAIVTRAAGNVSEGQALRQLATDPMFDSRLLAAVVLVGVGVALALGNDRAAWRRLLIGGGLAVPVVGVLAWLMGPGLDWLLAPVESTAGIVRVVAALVGGLAVTVMASASVHQVIGAFAGRLPPLGGPGAARKTKASAPNKSA